MDIEKLRRCGLARVGLVVILAGLVGACGEPTEPAPVFQKGQVTPVIGPMPAPPPALQVIVKRGQTLDAYAYTYHVPKSAIIAANGLRPPYQLKTGQRLAIPAAGGPMHPPATHPIAASPTVPPPMSLPPPSQAAIPQPPPTPQSVAPPGKGSPDVIPLDGPAPPKQAAAASPPTTSAPPPAATLTPPSAAPPRAAAQAGAAPSSGRFPWPVRGRVLANYGNTPGGGHNDGINIAAPRGTPVHAIDGGTVVYAGNEVKGYGNILLIRHSDGWISAYAHLGELGVKQGETISAGEVIGKVGDSGGVAEPQLHFELRRGKRPVDPKEFLAPAPSAEVPAGNTAG
jgi:murein DD-endopeptidase MepM/ murein hydrolase activator NlpD